MTKSFNVIIERDEDGSFVATVPGLRGCHTQAKSLDKLLERTREVIELYNTPQKLDRAIRWVIVCHNREGERIWQNKCGRVTMRLLKPKLPWKQ